MILRIEVRETRGGGISGPRCRRGASGQGMTEYLIILALIVIAAIGVYSFFGQSAVRQPPAGAAQKQPPGVKEATGGKDVVPAPKADEAAQATSPTPPADSAHVPAPGPTPPAQPAEDRQTDAPKTARSK